MSDALSSRLAILGFKSRLDTLVSHLKSMEEASKVKCEVTKVQEVCKRGTAEQVLEPRR